jgi:uncharacterized protein YjiS (DUF1127 family)
MAGHPFARMNGSGGAHALVRRLLLEPRGLSLLPPAMLWRAWPAMGYALLAQGAAAIGAWIRRSRQRHELAELSGRDLKDFGVSPAAAKRELRKPIRKDQTRHRCRLRRTFRRIGTGEACMSPAGALLQRKHPTPKPQPAMHLQWGDRIHAQPKRGIVLRPGNAPGTQ